MSATDTWCFQCRGASAIWSVNYRWHLTSSTLICLAMLHAWTLEYQHMMLCIWWWIPTKAERPAREDHRVALATSDSTRFRRMSTLYCYLRCEDLRSLGATERRSGSLGLRDDDDDDERWLVSKMEGKTIFSRHLQAVWNRNCWVFENHWRRV